jgi:hypothetical protein
MKRRNLLLGGCAAALGLGLKGFPTGWAADSSSKKRRVLFFTKSSGYEHAVVKREGDALALAERVLTDLGARHGFDVVATKDGSVFTPAGLDAYDAVFFYTTGDLTTAGTDKNPPMSPDGKAALFEAISNGKGFLGSHCATDTFHSPGEGRAEQPIDERDPYIQMIGGEFIVHGKQQESRIEVADNAFPATKGLNDYTLLDEWYALKNFAPDLHVLLVQQTQGMEGAMYHRPAYPATWARRHGKGRVFYTSMGHRDDVWTNPLFQQVLLGAISWATGNVEADVTPNLDSVTPGARELPPT